MLTILTSVDFKPFVLIYVIHDSRIRRCSRWHLWLNKLIFSRIIIWNILNINSGFDLRMCILMDVHLIKLLISHLNTRNEGIVCLMGLKSSVNHWLSNWCCVARCLLPVDVYYRCTLSVLVPEVRHTWLHPPRDTVYRLINLFYKFNIKHRIPIIWNWCTKLIARDNVKSIINN